VFAIGVVLGSLGGDKTGQGSGSGSGTSIETGSGTGSNQGSDTGSNQGSDTGSNQGSGTGSSQGSGSGSGSSANFKVGDTFVIKEDGKDLYSVTIHSAKLTSERNKYSDDKPTNVVIISYSFENLGMEDDLRISEYDFKVIDGDGNVCGSYFMLGGTPAKATPAGAKCSADMAFGLMSDKSDFKLMYYHMYNSKADATFDLKAE